MSRVQVSKAAAADLRGIGLYTQKTWGKDQRRKYLAGIKQKFRVLAETPQIAVLRTDFVPAVRIHPHDRHVIVYQDTADAIIILRVLHQSMDVEVQLSS